MYRAKIVVELDGQVWTIPLKRGNLAKVVKHFKMVRTMKHIKRDMTFLCHFCNLVYPKKGHLAQHVQLCHTAPVHPIPPDDINRSVELHSDPLGPTTQFSDEVTAVQLRVAQRLEAERFVRPEEADVSADR